MISQLEEQKNGARIGLIREVQSNPQSVFLSQTYQRTSFPGNDPCAALSVAPLPPKRFGEGVVESRAVVPLAELRHRDTCLLLCLRLLLLLALLLMLLPLAHRASLPVLLLLLALL